MSNFLEPIVFLQLYGYLSLTYFLAHLKSACRTYWIWIWTPNMRYHVDTTPPRRRAEGSGGHSVRSRWRRLVCPCLICPQHLIPSTTTSCWRGSRSPLVSVVLRLTAYCIWRDSIRSTLKLVRFGMPEGSLLFMASTLHLVCSTDHPTHRVDVTNFTLTLVFGLSNPGLLFLFNSFCWPPAKRRRI